MSKFCKLRVYFNAPTIAPPASDRIMLSLEHIGGELSADHTADRFKNKACHTGLWTFCQNLRQIKFNTKCLHGLIAKSSLKL